MFRAQLQNVDVLRDSVATIAEFIDEAQIKLSADGMHMTASDRAVVVVVDFFLSKNAFTYYEINAEHRIGVNVQNLLQILRRAAPNDIVTMDLDGHKMKISLDGDSARHFILPLIDVSRDETPPLDKLEFSTSFRTNLDVINSGVEDAELVTDSVVLTVRKDMLTMKAESDISSTQMELRSGSDAFRMIDVGEPVRARYSLDYLKKMIKARKLTSEASVSMSTDYPIKMEFEVPDLVRLSFILAPRIEE